MRILILEDEPIIALDLEDIVASSTHADCILASTIEEGLACIEEGVDFAMLDVKLGEGQTSLPVAQRLSERHVPFCFISSSLKQLPASYMGVPCVEKPYRPSEIARILPAAAA